MNNKNLTHTVVLYLKMQYFVIMNQDTLIVFCQTGKDLKKEDSVVKL